MADDDEELMCHGHHNHSSDSEESADTPAVAPLPNSFITGDERITSPGGSRSTTPTTSTRHESPLVRAARLRAFSLGSRHDDRHDGDATTAQAVVERFRTLSLEDISTAMRPRSNPRTRTPVRHESPLSPAWNRSNINQLDNDDDDDGDEGGVDRDERFRRVIASSIAAANAQAPTPVGGAGGAPLTGAFTGGSYLRAGFAAGADPRLSLNPRNRGGVVSESIQEQVSPGRYKERSAKQSQPSRRKIRRWNNDAMVGISAEIARSAKDPEYGAKMAEVFARGEADAVRFLRANHPREYRSVFADMVNDETGEKYGVVKERFVKGMVARSDPDVKVQEQRKKSEHLYSDGNLMFLQIEERLRRILVRVCADKEFSNTPREGRGGTDWRKPLSTVQILDAFEVYVISNFRSASSRHHYSEEQGGKDVSDEGWLLLRGVEEEVARVFDRILVQPPSVTVSDRMKSNCTSGGGHHHHHRQIIKARFLFDPQSSRGGFHRLLLHAVCQFHGLNCSSSLIRQELDGGDVGSSASKCITVTGKCRGVKFRLVDFVSFSRSPSDSPSSSLATHSRCGGMGKGVTYFGKSPTVQ